MKQKFLPVITVLLLVFALPLVARADEDNLPDSLTYAWKLLQPLGLREKVPMDTLLYNYYLSAVPSSYSPAFLTTGSQASVGKNMVFMDEEPMSEFFFNDAKRFWLPDENTQLFYNSRFPITQLGYNTGGGRENAQDYTRLRFSGNINPRLGIGMKINYPYTKGSYQRQAAKGFNWGLSAYYLGDRYELQTFFNTYNMANQENGGITDDLYITDPSIPQQGVSSINPRSIPVRLANAISRVRGKQFYMNHRYKLGYWHYERDSTDSVIAKDYVTVTSFNWTFNARTGAHKFNNGNASEGHDYWENHYLDYEGTQDQTRYNSIRNTFGISLLEGFNKYAKAGLSAFITHEARHYFQTPDTIPVSGDDRPATLTPYPFAERLQHRTTQNLAWVGAQLTKQQGSLLNYEATARLGIMGDAAGEIDVDGNVSTHFKLLGDTVTLQGYGHFSNTTAPFLMNHYISNHFAWDNDFSKIRRLRFGGVLNLPHTGTNINVGAENIQNHIYFNSAGLPVQNGGSVQVFSARLRQALAWRALHWDNTVVYQTSSDEAVIPLPKLAVYSNLYLHFHLATLEVQLGVDCDYYTKYKAPAYQPATMTFYNQSEVDCGNFPFMNAYANMKLARARFFVVFSHVNQGLFGKNDYFSTPHYPLNPKRFQMGVIVDFAN